MLPPTSLPPHILCLSSVSTLTERRQVILKDSEIVIAFFYKHPSISSMLLSFSELLAGVIICTPLCVCVCLSVYVYHRKRVKKHIHICGEGDYSLLSTKLQVLDRYVQVLIFCVHQPSVYPRHMLSAQSLFPTDHDAW